ncbi:TfuA-like protein [Neorhizobium galegae]|uniref:TfuA-like protein n=1 Tax=Neorhizobium galegae TaxID=399 RepID=UPI001EEB2A48|nr:TfuA-like protein [Neorhizobium galegae]UIK08493.1 antibiotic resistance protein [Neorhizobium galegae]
MKVLFVGPSLPEARRFVADDMIVRPPAMQGDVRLAVDEGARAIGLIDGAFEYVAPVWHKEILYGLSKGVAIFGAASMGALRAAECHAFGMTGIGEIFAAYASETRVDDADVALLHGPEELGYFAITIPMVNVDATVASCCTHGLICGQEARHLKESARSLFFKVRSWNAILANCSEIASGRANEVLRILRHNYLDQKRADAIALIDALRQAEAYSPPTRFEFNRTSLWRDD